MSSHRIAPSAGRVNYSLMPKGPNGRALCRWCHRECPAPRMTFCSPGCVAEHKIRSDPRYAREAVFARDRGVCAVCRVDTLAVQLDLRAKRPKARAELCEVLGYPLDRVKRGALWEADHLRPVAEGGGECGLPGYQTLCVACHRAKSAAQTTRRARA